MRHLRELVARRSRDVRDFAGLSASCHGAWPGLLSDILRDIGDEPCLRLLASASGQTTRIVSDPRLPLAHPLDADWRFTRQGARAILEHALDAAPEDGTILLVAMPTVALAAFDLGLGHRITVAARHGDATDRALRVAMPGVQFHDLAQAPSRPFDVVAIDPPWYDAIAMPMIAIASGAAKPGAATFVCVPDRYTLPSAARDLCALRSEAQPMGFGVVIGPVRYATPFFELRCLQAKGITNIDPAWRTGLLVRCGCSRMERPASRARFDARETEPRGWAETTYGAIRLWHRPAPKAFETGRVAIAGSISAGDPQRATAWMWTSGNLVATGAGAPAPDGVASDDFIDRIVDRSLREELSAALDAEVAAIAESVEPDIG